MLTVITAFMLAGSPIEIKEPQPTPPVITETKEAEKKEDNSHIGKGAGGGVPFPTSKENGK